MTLRPAAARWFELLTDREHLGGVLGCLADTSAVQLEAYSGLETGVALPDYARVIEDYAQLERRYRAYWPAVRIEAKTFEERSVDRVQADLERLDEARLVLDDEDRRVGHTAPPSAPVRAPMSTSTGTSAADGSSRSVRANIGSCNVNVLPTPSVDSTATRPPWRLATCRTIERPRPVPPVPRLRARSTR